MDNGDGGWGGGGSRHRAGGAGESKCTLYARTIAVADGTLWDLMMGGGGGGSARQDPTHASYSLALGRTDWLHAASTPSASQNYMPPLPSFSLTRFVLSATRRLPSSLPDLPHEPEAGTARLRIRTFQREQQLGPLETRVIHGE